MVICRIQAIYQAHGDGEPPEKGYDRTYAREIERCIFDMAKSRPDYYIQMAEEITKLNSLSWKDFIQHYYSTWSMIVSDEFTNNKSYEKMMNALAEEEIMRGIRIYMLCKTSRH